MTPPLDRCDFCFRQAVNRLTRQRRGPLDVLLRRPAPSVDICLEHLARGLDHIRSWRLFDG